MTAKLRSEIWIHAYLARVNLSGGFAHIAKKGDIDAGSILIHIVANREFGLLLDRIWVLGDDESQLCWRWLCGPSLHLNSEIEQKIAQSVKFDRDIWVIEVEDTKARYFIDDVILT